MSIDQHRKKGMRGKNRSNEGGYGTIPDGLGYNDPFNVSKGNPSDRVDPDVLMKSWIIDADLGRVQQAEIASRSDGCSDYTKP